MDNMELTLTIEEEPQATLNLGVAEGATDEASARTAEAYAKGTRNGVPVEEGDPAYHNNAKYYRDSAAAIAAGDVIDDDAGAGDYDLTWSADKLTSQKADIEELESSKADAIDVQIDTPASVMTFSDGGDGYPLSATFEIAPVQDLHGQANPWPAGGGKNKWSIGDFEKDTSAVYVSKTIDTLPAGTYTISALVTSGDTTKNKLGISFRGTTNVKVYLDANTGNRTNATFILENDCTTIYIYGGYGTTDAYAGTMTDVQIESGSSATSFAPYENLCPITGWTGCKPTATGKNLCKLESGKINTTTGAEQDDANTSRSGWMKIESGADYFFSGISGSIRIFRFDKYKNLLGNAVVDATGGVTRNFSEGTVWVRFQGNNSVFSNSVQVEKGSSATTYQAFGKALDISFPAGAGTVYGGTQTVNKDGTGSIGDEYIMFNAGELTWTLNSAGSTYADYYYQGTASSIQNGWAMSNMFKFGSGEPWTITTTQNRRIWLMVDPSIDTTDKLQTFLTNNPTQILCKRYSVQTTALTATEAGQILSLLGTNNLFCDTGDVLSVDYTADTKLYVEKQISASQRLMELIVTANREDTMKATKAYSSGDLMIVNATLYKATTSIANGATLTVGTNVTATTVADEIAALA